MQSVKTAPLATRLLFASCILPFAFLVSAGCARTPAAVTPTRPDPIQQLRQDVAAATNAPGVQRASWGIVVQSLDRDERLVGVNPRMLLVPASTAKIVSLAAAAEAVGWDFRFETTVRATAPIVDGVIHGDLVVVGSGDPSIGGRGGADLTAWVDSLKTLGLRRVDGRVIGDDDRIEEPRPQLAWAWDDLGYPTGAIFGALNYAENRMTVTVTPGAAPAAPASLSVDPSAGTRPLANRALTGAPGTTPLLWPEQD